VQAALLAVAHGLHEAVPAPPEQRLVEVPNSSRRHPDPVGSAVACCRDRAPRSHSGGSHA
jgi:hypothetical protein